ncbi:MAG TPA: HAD hydrolase-like protein [Chthoniobacterales bacterium]
MRRLARWIFSRQTAPPPKRMGTPEDRVVVFDFDGTIADTFDAALSILNRLSGEFGYRTLQESEIPQAREMNVRQLLKFLGIPMSKMPVIAHKGVHELHSRMREIQPFPEVPGVLRELHRRGCRLGIITSNSQENVAQFLRMHELQLFDFVCTSSRLFGKTREIRGVLKRFGWKAPQLHFVGDECRDIEAAKKAKILMTAVTWGYNARHVLESLKPDFVIQKPHELLTLVPESAARRVD